MKKDAFKILFMQGSDALWEEVDMELARNISEIQRLKKHDRLMRDKAHQFNSELQSYKNRTCENCKYDNYANSICDLKRIIPAHYIDGFYCNRWESN